MSEFNKNKLKEKVILHCDVNNFFASVECLSKIELKNKPVAVSGNPETRTGIILAKNDIAKNFGVKTGESIYEAKMKCPHLVCLPPHYDLYEKISKQIIEIYYDYTDTVESFGIDECWLDVTESVKLLGNGKTIADNIRERVLKEIGLTISVGVSFCKIFAKLGSDYKKPFATTVISRKNFKTIVYPLPVESIIGIGLKKKKKLAKMNVKTLGEYVNIPDKILKTKFGINGVILKQKLLGFDFDDVIDNNKKVQIKSVGNGITTNKNITTKKQILDVVVFLSNKISKRLEEKNLYGHSITVSIKTDNFEKYKKSVTFNEKIFLQVDIVKLSMKIINSFWDYKKEIRAIRISVKNLNTFNNPTQLSFFDKSNKLEKSINKMKKKYGENSITFASLIKNKYLNK